MKAPSLSTNPVIPSRSSSKAISSLCLPGRSQRSQWREHRLCKQSKCESQLRDIPACLILDRLSDQEDRGYENKEEMAILEDDERENIINIGEVCFSFKVKGRQVLVERSCAMSLCPGQLTRPDCF